MQDMNCPKPEAERKSKALRVMLTADERAKLKAAAAKEGLNLSTWLRRIGLREVHKLVELS